MAGMAIASTVLSVAGAAAQAANNYQNFQTQAQAANANAKVAENNARNVLIESSYAQDQKLKEGRQYISNQYVRNMQSGAGGAGTTGDRAVAKSVYNLDKDLSMLAYNYGTKATDYLNQSKVYKYESKVAKANAANSLIAGGLNVANSLLASKSFGNNAGGAGGGLQVSPMAQELNRSSYARNSLLWY